MSDSPSQNAQREGEKMVDEITERIKARPTPARDALALALSESVARRLDGMLDDYVAELRRRGFTVHAPGESCPQLLRERFPHIARLTDPMTSHAAAPTLPSQRSAAFEILSILEDDADADDRCAYIDEGRTADELAENVGRPVWRRLSDLKRLGLVEPLVEDGKPVTRPGKSGHEQAAHRITLKGRAYVQEIRDRT